MTEATRGSRNLYTRRFSARCPVNDCLILYTLTIETDGRVLRVERIAQATDDIKRGFHESIADLLSQAFGGRQVLVANHHGVGITTLREGS